MRIEDCEPGSSYACRFRITTFLDSEGTPVAAQLQQGEAHPGAPGEYTSLGVIRVRDLEQGRVEIVDTASTHTFVVSTNDIWDIDTVEWVDKP